jgi:hypothetical protein
MKGIEVMIAVPQRSRLDAVTRHLVAAAAVMCVALLVQTDYADAQMGGGRGSGPHFGMRGTGSGTGGGSGSSGKLQCVGSGCPQFGQKAPSSGTNKANPNPVTRDHRGETNRPTKAASRTIRPCRQGWKQGGYCDRFNRPIKVRDHRNK